MTTREPHQGARWATSVVRRSEIAAALTVAVGLTMVFWPALWMGGGISGSDVYTYSYPQKAFLADRLRAGELPFWNNLTGFGYPLIAESLTGVFYPPNLLVYRFLNLQTAFTVNQLLHYVAAFWLMWRFSREVGLTQSGALTAALVYTYGWFPPRLCWEWAIVGGAYLPGVLWCAERFLRTGHARTWGIAACLLGLQMLAGHYNLAFITQLCLVAYVGCRLLFARSEVASRVLVRRAFPAALVVGAIAGAMLIASAQLVPSWKMRQLSDRRASIATDFDPGDGHIPPWYLTQLVASWWYWDSPGVNRDQALERLRQGTNPSPTNQVEAHLYFGLLPLMLVVCAFAGRKWRHDFADRRTIAWFCFAIAAIVYTTGLLFPLARHLPGFAMFHGPARFGIVATLAMAILGGRALDVICRRLTAARRWAIPTIVFVLTVADLRAVGLEVTYATVSLHTSLSDVVNSPIGALLRRFPQPVRVYAPSPNVANLLGVSSLPIYLGFLPSQYAGDKRTTTLEPVTADLLDWAERSGITHVISTSSLAAPAFDSRLREVFHGAPTDSLFVYELTRSDGRAVVWPSGSGSLRITAYRANRVDMHVDASRDAIVILRDLFYPGWSVTVDGRPAPPRRVDRQFRGVDVPAGVHTVVWHFWPW